MAKVALLIGVSKYEVGLTPLPAAVKDVVAFERILRDSEMGDFDEVKILTNPEPQTMQYEVETLFSNCGKDDFVLLFFSGHGIKDEANNLYFATRITKKSPKGNLIKSTAVPAKFIHDVMNVSRAKRQAIILDCCFSGAFDPNLQSKDDGSVDLQGQLGAEGRVVLTSSSSTQYSFEQQGSDLSLYTRYLIEGIETGAGDIDEDGKISVRELHDYATSKVQETAPSMTPKLITLKDLGFDLVLAKAKVTDPKLRYRRQVEKYSSRGAISSIGRTTLDSLQAKLGLSAEVTKAIESDVLRPYQERMENLQRYRQTFEKEVKREYPLSIQSRSELDDLWRVLGLRREHIEPIEEGILDQILQDSAISKEDYQERLRLYEQEFRLVIKKVDYPLNEYVRKGLRDFQDSLRLKLVDIEQIERPIIDSKENEYRQKLEAEKIKQKQEQEQLKREQERIDYQNNLQKYEQHFSKAVKAEYPLGQHILDGLKNFQKQLGLKENDVNRIERPIIDSKESEYRQKLEAEKIKQKQEQEQLKREQERIDYQNNLQKYEQYFSKAVTVEYPLSQHILDGLEKCQKQLGLKKDDVTRIEKSIREPLEAKYQQQLKEKRLADKQRQLELEQKVQKKAKHENNLQRYEQEFSKAVKAEYPLSQHVLNGLKTFQKQMNLTDEDVAKIEKPIIGKLDFQYQQQLRQREVANEQMKTELDLKRQKIDRENKVRRYEQEFSKAVKAEYPLSQHVLDGLKTFQKQMNLTDEDVAKIEKPIVEPLEAKYQQQIKQKEHKNNLLRYEHQLSIAIQMEYPLSQYVLDGLKKFQQQLGLTDKDVAIAKQKVEAQQHQKR